MFDPTPAATRRRAANERLAALRAELGELMLEAAYYEPGERVQISHPRGAHIEAEILRRLEDGLTYEVRTAYGVDEMEARYFV